MRLFSYIIVAFLSIITFSNQSSAQGVENNKEMLKIIAKRMLDLDSKSESKLVDGYIIGVTTSIVSIIQILDEDCYSRLFANNSGSRNSKTLGYLLIGSDIFDNPPASPNAFEIASSIVVQETANNCYSYSN